MNSNQNLTINGTTINSIDPIRGNSIAAVQGGFLDSSIVLSSFLEIDPMRNMIMLQNKWDEQVMKKGSFASSIYQRVIGSNAVLEVSGQDGGFKYKQAIETDNCFRTVEDTSDQSADGYIGASGTTFRVVLNRKVSPNQVITTDKAYSDAYLIVAESPEPVYVGNGYEHYVSLMGSVEDKNKVYMANLLEADVVYQVASGSYITELSEKLGVTHYGATTSYLEGEFKLGSGQGMEGYVTGKADSYNTNPGFTTVDSQKAINDLVKASVYDTNMALILASIPGGKDIKCVGEIMEIMTINGFNKNFNSSMMFMPAAKISTSKGVIEVNEGLWQQMRRGKIFTYAKKENFTETDLQAVRNYVYKYNTSRPETTFLHIEAGSQLADNLERLINNAGLSQINNAASLLGASAVLPGKSFVSGTWDALVINPVKIVQAMLPGIGMLSVKRDTTLDKINEDRDIRYVGSNPHGYDDTTYSGYIWDVEDQEFSNNAKLPEGTTSITGNKVANKNVYLIRPDRNPIVFGNRTGRYSYKSKQGSQIQATSNLMGEGFFIYGFGAMWMPDPRKFVLIEVKRRNSNR